MKNKQRRIVEKVAEIYNWLDEQIRSSNYPAEPCRQCGQCCHFDKFDHHLFVTSPELIYLENRLGEEKLKPMPKSRCPYNDTDGKCMIYQHRFAACRIFRCNADADTQSSLSEAVLKKLKAICTEFQIPYHYTDLSDALNRPGSDH